MATTDRFFKAFKDVLLLTEAVKGLGQDIKDLNQEVRQLDRRMIRLETMVELAEKRQLPAPRD